MKYEESLLAGLEFIRGHANYLENKSPELNPLTMIDEGRGHWGNCVWSVETVHSASAMLAWFEQHDLSAFKQHAYVAGKLMYMRKKAESELGVLRENEFFPLLFSDYEPLIRLFSGFRFQSAQRIRESNNSNEHAFRHYQMTLALAGDWEILANRARQQLDAQPKRMRSYMVDQRFYLALARGEKAAMEEAINELTTLRKIKSRGDQFSFRSELLFGAHATMFAKIAWRAGYEVEVGSPYIPKEWLPIKPLAEYKDPYPFMREFQTDWA